MGTLSGQKFDQTKYNQVKFNMIKNVKDLIKRYGPDAEKVIHGRALKTALNSTEMKENRIREIIHQALSEKKEFPDLTGDGKVTKADILKGRGVKLKEYSEEVDTLALTFKDPNEFERAKEHFESNSDFYPFEISDEFKTFYFQVQDQADADSTEFYLNQELEGETGLQGYYFSIETSPLNLDEDLDLGHTDDEPHMLKADLYKIGKYAMELYQMVDRFEGQGEVDFPHWWQAKIIKAASMMSSAKHYLEFELKEPQVDAMVGIASSEEVIDDAPIMEDEVGEIDKLAADIQKASNKNKSAEDQNNIKQARKAMNDGNIEAAKKILKPYLDEKLTAKTPMKKYIKDFAKSDAPQFKDKSKEKKRQMAVAAKLSAENPTEGLAEIILNKLKNR